MARVRKSRNGSRTPSIQNLVGVGMFADTGTIDAGTRPDRRQSFSVLFALGAVCALLGAAVDCDALLWAGGFAVVIFGIGSAPFQLYPQLSLPARTTLSFVTGMSLLMSVGALMADISGLWHPLLAAVLTLIAAIALHGLGLRSAFASTHPEPTGEHGTRSRTRSVRNYLAAQIERLRYWTADLREASEPPLIAVVSGTVCWLAATLATGHESPTLGGFPATITPVWFIGVLLVLGGLAFGGENNLTLGAAAVSLMLATTLTPVLIYDAPRSQSAGKQIELVQLIAQYKHMDTEAGVYQAYTGFMAGIAWLASVLGAGIIKIYALATYWPVLMGLARIPILRLLALRTGLSSRRAWLMIVLVVLVDALGADYFSPQSYGYTIAIAVFALTIRGPLPSPIGRAALLGVLALAAVALAPAHELSPFMTAGVLAVFVIFGQAPLWSPIVMAVPAMIWAGLHWSIVHKAASFGDLFSITNFAPPHTTATVGLSRLPIVGYSSHALFLGLAILVAIGTLSLWQHRRTRWAWAWWLCCGVGLVFIAFNPYGNEGIFRAALFAIPWLALLSAHVRVSPRLAARPALTVGAPIVLYTALFGTFLLAAFGMDASGVMRKADFKAGLVFLEHAPKNSVLLNVGFGDDSVDGPLIGLNTATLNWADLVKQGMLRPGHPTAADLQHLTQLALAQTEEQKTSPDSRLYFAWSPIFRIYAREYGLQTPSQSDRWLQLIWADEGWRLDYERDGTYLFSRPLAAIEAGSS